MNKKYWFAGFVIILLFSLNGRSFSQQKFDKLIKFSHKFHVTEAEAFCTDCHASAETSVTSTDDLFPDMERCGYCHDVDSEDNCTKCHIGEEENWQALPRPQKTLRFNHKLHVGMKDIKCQTCHRDIEKVDFATKKNLPEMQVCSQCHNNVQAPLECTNCHTSTLNLRPQDHTADYMVTHKNVARFGEEECAVCHTDNDCAECHEGASLFTTTSGSNKDIQTPFYPSGIGTKGLVVTRVHELNFRFTHPLEAQGRTQECAVCHETNNFCQSCHESEGVDVAGKPLWHGGPDWGALAGVVGTGGGRHAELAKRDIESCAGCHSTQGDDPTCLLCHTDFDGVLGTNPKTHEGGFKNRFGEGSSYHDDDTAVCFSCHTDTNQAGVGFCGYCHGPKDN